MPVLTSIFLVVALILAVVIGPQTRTWPWGPAMLALGIAVSAALPSLWRKSRVSGDFGITAFGALVAAWFAWRAWISPVHELAVADLMLLAGVVGCFICVKATEENLLAQRILNWGIALLLLASVLVAWRQVVDRDFVPVFRSRSAGFVSGFYAHYNEGANYYIASSFFVAAAALFGPHRFVTRIFWLLLAIGGLTAVYFTHSRGAILGAALGLAVFLLAALMIGKRIKAKWFGPALIAIPLIGLIICGFLYVGWREAQELRQAGTGIKQMMDNTGRLYLLGIAMSCIGLHPLAGGGSRSFSWENFRFSDGKAQGGIITHIPEQVHNELLQATTDYGLIGAVLLIVLLGSLGVLALVRTLFQEPKKSIESGDAWRVGGLAALAGMFVQSCFSFVFHLMPGAILLGISLGFISRGSTHAGRPPQVIGAKVLLTTAAIFCAALLIPMGWKGTQVTRILWPVYLGKNPLTTAEAKSDALGEALRIWPQASLYQDRAFLYQEASTAASGVTKVEMGERAIADYQEAELLHPFDPNPVINRANVLSQLQQDEDAENAYNRAISLQGGMEPSFRAHYSLVKHLMQKGRRQFNIEYPADSLATLEIAAQQMEAAVKKMHWTYPDMLETWISVYESLGAAREANGDYTGAMKAYDTATMLHKPITRAHYRAGVLNGKLAAIAWSSRRSAEALWYFIEAKRRIEMAKTLPIDIAPSQRLEYLAYLDETINYLKGAKIEPLAPSR